MPHKKNEKFGVVGVLNAAMAVTPELYVMEHSTSFAPIIIII